MESPGPPRSFRSTPVPPPPRLENRTPPSAHLPNPCPTTPPKSGTTRKKFADERLLLREGIELRPLPIYLNPCHSPSPKTGTSCTKSQENREQESKTAIRRPKQLPPSHPARPDAPRPAVANPYATLRNNRGPLAIPRGPCCARELNFQQVVVEAEQHLSNWLNHLELVFKVFLQLLEITHPLSEGIRGPRTLNPVPKLSHVPMMMAHRGLPGAATATLALPLEPWVQLPAKPLPRQGPGTSRGSVSFLSSPAAVGYTTPRTWDRPPIRAHCRLPRPRALSSSDENRPRDPRRLLSLTEFRAQNSRM